MNWKWAKWRPAMAWLLASALLLIGQAACQLAMPAVMKELVTVGVRQEGLETGMPEAMSAQGMELLKSFLTENERRRFEGMYHNIGPGSSESQRLSARYPLVTETNVCVRREGLTDLEQEYGSELYSRTAYAILLYLQNKPLLPEEPEPEPEQPEETAPEEDAAGEEKEPAGSGPGAFGENVRDPSGDVEVLPEGVLGKVPEGAIVAIPGETGGDTPPVEEVLEERPLPVFDVSGGAIDDSLAHTDLEELYAMLPALERGRTAEEVHKAAENAKSAAPARCEQVGFYLKKSFYRELGIDIKGRRSGAITGGTVRLIVLAAIGLACAVLAWLFAGWARVSRDGLRLLTYVPVLFLGSAILAFFNSTSSKWTALFAVVLAFGTAVFLLRGAILGKIKMLRSFWQSCHAFGGTLWCGLLLWAVPMIIEIVCALVLRGRGASLAASPQPIGEKIAYAQYALQTGLATAAAIVLLPGRKERPSAPEEEETGAIS